MGCGLNFSKQEIHDYLFGFVKNLNLNNNSIREIMDLMSNQNYNNFQLIINYIYVNNFLQNEIKVNKFPDYKTFFERYFLKINEKNIYGLDVFIIILIIFSNLSNDERKVILNTFIIYFENTFHDNLIYFELYKSVLHIIIVLPLEIIYFLTLDLNFKNEIKNMIEIDYNKEIFDNYCKIQYNIFMDQLSPNKNYNESFFDCIFNFKIENLIKDYNI